MSKGSGALSPPDAAKLSRRGAPIGLFLAFFGTTFNTALCALNTAGLLVVSSGLIAAIQIGVLGAGLAAVRSAITSRVLEACLILFGSTFALHLINPGSDLKILFDLGLIPIFIWLGRRASTAQAQRLVEVLLVLVAVLGLAEMFLPDWFQKTFDILQYYNAKDPASADAPNYTSGNFLINGERPENIGRGLFPGLFSAHRAASIFLESVSAGNFPIICLAWLLSAKVRSGAGRYLAFALVGLCIVLPDSRFAAICCALVIAVRFTGLYRSTIFVALLPIGIAATLWFVGSLQLGPGEAPRIVSDDFVGRLMFSGGLLASWTWRNWLGLDVSPITMSDNGYAYLINNLGIFWACFIWLFFALQPVRTVEALKLRGLLSVYVACDLSIGTSVFSIKTAAFAWLLYGAAQAAGRRQAHRSAARHSVVTVSDRNVHAVSRPARSPQRA